MLLRGGRRVHLFANKGKSRTTSRRRCSTRPFFSPRLKYSEDYQTLASFGVSGSAALLGKYKPSAATIDLPKIIMLRSRGTPDCERLCGVRYPWISDQSMRSEAILAGENTVRQEITALDVPNNRFENFLPLGTYVSFELVSTGCGCKHDRKGVIYCRLS